MYILTELVCITIEIWMVHLYLSYSFPQKGKQLPIILANTIYFIGLTTLSFMNNMAFARLLFTFLSITIIANKIYNSTLIQSLIHSLVYCVFIIIADLITSSFFFLFHMDVNEMLKLGSGRSLYIIIGHLVLFFGFLLLLFIRPLMNLPYSIKEFASTLPCMIITVLLCYILTTQYIFNGIEIPFLYIIVLIGLLYTNVFFLFFIYTSHAQAIQKQEYELSKQHFLMQQKYYNQLHIQQESIRSLWHDLNKYISAAKIDSSESLDQLQKQLNEITATFDTNNRIVNIILNEYINQSKEINVKIDFDINVPDELPMTAADLYIVLGNSLDNALDACSFLDTEKRKLNMKLRFQNNILYYELSNPYIDCSVKTTKQVHGYGIKNIRKIADKYNGVVLIDKENNIFTLSAHFNF